MVKQTEDTIHELREEYTILFNGITKTIDALEQIIENLRLFQIKAEDAFLSAEAETQNAERENAAQSI